MTAQRIWVHENKLTITDATKDVVPGGQADPKWIGEYSRQSTFLWHQACSLNPNLEDEYNDKAERFNDGQASPAVKAR